ncbi:hypothetical protein G4G28_00425 [Massilia sp. Dwa41.01b]|uniref:hypothetical protein n=1 Tax=unclassified Massilia TaxID=2609279 RepID=UPI0016029CCD|nr:MULTISPECIES: hypothetical protein [unclassified Massilia]QNA87315.1 hypothetical protein G4G28_00425 [Massilia sp. Dwa41.01b]QNA98220.1 hypothetical protein G4G31_04180 [Massilia sp. Se16.2.3]
MGHSIRRITVVAALLGLAACAGPRPQPLAVLQYQHVANAHEIRFTNPIPLSAALYRVGHLSPVDAHGFWAIFVLCNVDVTEHARRGFHYNVNNFRVSYEGREYGGLPPYTLRYQGQAELNTRGDATPLLDAIAAEIQEGPPEQIFQSGFYPDLNYRFAVFVPKTPANYAGEQLTLTYKGQPAILVGNGKAPSDLPAVGGTAAGMAAACVPPQP